MLDESSGKKILLLQATDKKKDLATRALSFAGVGVIATGSHGLTLCVLELMDTPMWAANILGFIAGFFVSFNLQQRYAFKDRLGGSFLNKKAGLFVFLLNLVLAALLGLLIKHMPLLLPLAPAVINYVAYYRITGSSTFKTKKP